MAVKTITIMEDAYKILKGMKSDTESFSDVIRRIGKKRPLSEFIGILSKESGDRLEKHIKEKRKIHAELYKERIKRIRAQLRATDGSS